MGKLFIPALGTKLVLAEPWTFQLYGEYRNRGFADAMRVKFDRSKETWQLDSVPPVAVTLHPGAELTVRRVYIRQGQKGFDSLTFTIKINKKLERFWVKLDCANRIVFED